MDPTTIEAYNTHGEFFTQGYRSSERMSIQRLQEAFQNRSRILEVGTGSGVDMARLLKAGFKVTGLEPSEELIKLAGQHFPDLLGRIQQGSLPLNEKQLKPWREQFEGILCNAVLMHIPANFQQQTLHNLHDILLPDGRLLLTVSATRDGLDEARRDEFGRYYAELPEERVIELCETAGLRLIQTWETDDQRHIRGLRWSTYLLRRETV